MPNEQLTKILAAICRSLDHVEQRRDKINHLYYGITGEDGIKEIMHIIIFRTPPYEDDEEENDEEENEH